jgi:hypothetical protein
LSRVLLARSSYLVKRNLAYSGRFANMPPHRSHCNSVVPHSYRILVKRPTPLLIGRRPLLIVQPPHRRQTARALTAAGASAVSRPGCDGNSPSTGRITSVNHHISMGIDIYTRYSGQTPEERDEQSSHWLCTDGGQVGYLREAFQGDIPRYVNAGPTASPFWR